MSSGVPASELPSALAVLSAAGLRRGDPFLASLHAGLAACGGPVAGPLDLGGARLTHEGPPPAEALHAPLHLHAAAGPADVLSLLRALAAAGVPLNAAARRDGDPLLVLAGPAALPNPEPVAAFFDAILVGDPAVALRALAEAWAASGPAGRGAVAQAWLACPGAYVPAAYRPAYREDGVLEAVTAVPGALPRVPAHWAPPAPAIPSGRPGVRPLAPHLWGWDPDTRGRPRGVTAVLGAARAELRLRAGVPLADAEMEQLLDRIAEAGAHQVELEFVLGLPGETDADADGIVSLVKQLRHRLVRGGRGAGRPPDIVPAVTTFSPLPWTATQWAPLADVRDLARRHRELAKALSKVGDVSLLRDVPKWAYVQNLLGRGDRRMGALFALALEANGDWAAACRGWHLNADFFVYRARRPDEVFPWDHLDVGITKTSLREEAAAHGLVSSLAA